MKELFQGAASETATMIPSVVDMDDKGNRISTDVVSNLFMRGRIVFLNGPVNAHSAIAVTAQLLHLDTVRGEGGKPLPIQLYINSPGGVVTDGMMIYNTMKSIASPVHTTCVGQAASMGSFLLMAGEPGHRRILPEARVMVHQVSAGTQGKLDDMRASFNEADRLNTRLTELYVEHCGGTYDEWYERMKKDHFVGAEEAKKLGLVDHIGFPAPGQQEPANQNNGGSSAAPKLA